uniref:Cag pathogenicity island protein n=1 Tax=Helicobacter pylori TaxID=210 RepID=Q75XJ2_HELPX|nr:cag pathogenicity island protein [Helicobacter pylori]
MLDVENEQRISV